MQVSDSVPLAGDALAIGVLPHYTSTVLIFAGPHPVRRKSATCSASVRGRQLVPTVGAQRFRASQAFVWILADL